MYKMIAIGFLGLAIGLGATGCAFERLALPSSTPFDADPELRAAYLENYRTGYRMAGARANGVHCRRFEFAFRSQERRTGRRTRGVEAIAQVVLGRQGGLLLDSLLALL